MTRCVHKMCERTYGQTNMKRAITLAKINHPWNLYNMRLSMRILYRFHGWLIFARVIAIFMFVWPYVHSHILCTQLKSFVVCRILFIFGILIGHDLSMCILCRFHGWLIFARVIALFMFVWPYVHSQILCTQLKSFVVCHILFMTDIWSNKHEKGYNSQKINHPWNRYNMGMLRSWSIKIPNMNKMWQTTNDLSCVHKMCEWTFGQTNMKRAITLAKINHPWNRHNMHMLRSWP
jgi:hypothetical protein